MATYINLASKFDDKGIKSAQKSFGSLGSQLGKLTGVITAAFSVRAIANFAGDALKAAEAAEVANNRLDQIASSMGVFGVETSVVTGRLKAFADQQMMVIGQDDELIKSTQAKLLTFKNLATTADEAGGAFDRATIAAFDMAAAGFGSAETNAVQLGKALQDPIKGITALARSGITFTAQEKEKIATLVESNKMLEAQDLILQAIENQVGGTAAATVTESQKMNIAMGELTEQIGTYLLPAFEDMASTGVNAITEMLDPSTELGADFAETSAAAGVMFQTIADGFASFSENGGFKVLLDFLETVFIGFSQILWVVGDAADTIGKFLSGDYSGATKNIETFFTRYNKFVQDTYDDIDNRAKKSAAVVQNSGENNRFKNLQTSITTNNTNNFKNPTTTTNKTYDKLRGIIKTAQANILKAERDYEKTKYEINRDYEERVSNLRKNAAKEQENLIRESQLRITDAFKSATQISLGDLFTSNTTRQLETQVKQLTSRLTLSVTKETEKTTYASVTDMIKGLRDRLAASKTLLANASKLAGLGFKQTFIEQIFATGAETGNALAGAILESAPETQAELKTLFNEMEDTSETGASVLAKNIYDKFGLATREMRDQSITIQKELTDALAEENKILLKNLADAAYAFQTQIADIKTQFLLDLDEFDGKFAGLGNTIKAVLGNLQKLLAAGSGDIQNVITDPNAGGLLAGAKVTSGMTLAQLQNSSGIVIDSVTDIAGAVAYLQERIKAANAYIKLASSNASQDAAAAALVTDWTKQLTELQGKAATGTAAGTVININVRTDTAQSQAMVGKTIGKIVTKYVTTGGQVLVSGS